MLIDCHTHACRTHSVPRSNGTDYPDGEQLVGRLDELGINMAVVLAGVSPECRNRYVPPEDVVEICEAHPDRLIPFCNIDPRAGSNSPDTDFSRFLDVYREMGCRGVGEMTANLDFDDSMCWNLFGQIADYGLPMTIHIAPALGGFYGLHDDLGLPRLERTLQEFPDLIVLGHSQPFWAEISADVTQETRNGYPDGEVTPGRLVELFESYENLWGDLSAGSGHNAISRDPEFGNQFIEQFQDRLMFGTDVSFPEYEPPLPDYFRSLRGEISNEAWEKVAWRNIDRLLELGVDED
ncbi:MAG: amidohydrolase family protein [Armatimonadota bacterium]